MSLFQNHYICPDCCHQWQDDDECKVDDECPRCGARDCSPVESYEYPQYGDRYKCLDCFETIPNPGIGGVIIECPYCGSQNLDCILPDGTIKFSQKNGEVKKKVKEAKKKVKVVVYVESGCVQQVFSNDPNVDVMLVDAEAALKRATKGMEEVSF